MPCPVTRVLRAMQQLDSAAAEVLIDVDGVAAAGDILHLRPRHPERPYLLARPIEAIAVAELLSQGFADLRAATPDRAADAVRASMRRPFARAGFQLQLVRDDPFPRPHTGSDAVDGGPRCR